MLKIILLKNEKQFYSLLIETCIRKNVKKEKANFVRVQWLIWKTCTFLADGENLILQQSEYLQKRV